MVHFDTSTQCHDPAGAGWETLDSWTFLDRRHGVQAQKARDDNVAQNLTGRRAMASYLFRCDSRMALVYRNINEDILKRACAVSIKIEIGILFAHFRLTTTRR